MGVAECGRAQPGVKGCLVPPPRHHEPGGALVGRLEELEALEALLVVDRARPGGEPAGKFVPAIGWPLKSTYLLHTHGSLRASRVGVPASRAALAPTAPGVAPLA